MSASTQNLGFLGWAFSGGVFFGDVAGSTLGSIGAALIGAGAIPAFRTMQTGSPNDPAVFVVCLVLGVGFLAGGYSQYASEFKDGPRKGEMPLISAARMGNRSMAERLLTKGVEVNARNDKGETALHWTARTGHKNKDVAELLLAKGAEVNAKDNIGYMALHWAARTGNRGVMELLLAKGAEINAKDSEGLAPLHWAAICGHRDIAELLLTSGAEVNARTEKGKMALHWAANIARRDVVELLLTNGAEINARDGEGKTALQETVSGQVGVRAKEYKGIAELLRQHGGLE